MTTAVSNLDNAWSQLAGTVTKEIFKDTKKDIVATTSVIEKLNIALEDYLANIKNVDDIHHTNSIKIAKRELEQLRDSYRRLKEEGKGWFDSEESYDAKLKKQAFLIASLERKIKRLASAKDGLVKGEQKPWYDVLPTLDGSSFVGLDKKSEEINNKFLEKQKNNYLKYVEYKTGLEFDAISAKWDYEDEQEAKAKAKKLKDNAQWIKDLKEFYAIDIDKDLNDQNKKVEATFHNWADTLNSSISNSIVDAIQSGDVEGAIKGLGSSIGSSMLQSSVSNIVAGGDTLKAAGGLSSMGGLYGIAAGVGITAIMGILGRHSHTHQKTSAELLKEYQDRYIQQASDYEHSVKPITDRLDRQIELLKAISGYGGTAVSNELKKAQETYSRQSVVDTLKAVGLMGQTQTFKASKKSGPWYNPHWSSEKMTLSAASVGSAAYEKALEKKYSEYVKGSYGRLSLNHSKTWGALQLNQSTQANASKYIEFLMKLKDNKDLANFGITNQEYKDIINQAEKTTHDFAMSVINSYQTIFDSGKSFKDDYDKLFGDYYKNKALAQAQADVNKLRGGQSLQSYLKDVITTIDSMKLTKAQIDLLQSENEKDLPAKIKLEKELSQQYGKNVEAALNYKDSIDLVAQSMGDNVKALNDAWLGQYSPLTMLQKTAYANSIANNVIPSTMSASEKALLALQQSQATATTDEQARAAFNRYVATLDAQVEDSSRTDIVNAIQTSNEKLDELIYKTEALAV